MTRATLQPPWNKLFERVRTRPRESTDHQLARREIALVHAVVILAASVTLELDAPPASGQIAVWILVLLAFAMLRTLTAGNQLASSTLVLEPIGVALFLAGTGGTDSPFFALALSGIWWAARGRAHLRTYVGILIGSYLLLVLVEAAGEARAEAVEELVVLIGFSIVIDTWSRMLDSWPRSQKGNVFGAGERAIREGLGRALTTLDIPIDAVLSAGQVGLTALQAELLAYLELGLSNQEISDATRVSEAAVRYRLTRLYRILGVAGRKQAAARARELGVTVMPSAMTLGRSA